MKRSISSYESSQSLLQSPSSKSSKRLRLELEIFDKNIKDIEKMFNFNHISKSIKPPILPSQKVPILKSNNIDLFDIEIDEEIDIKINLENDLKLIDQMILHSY